MQDRSDVLAGKLEALTEAAIDRLSSILTEPLDVKNASLLRAQAASGAVALNAQLRADALRLRVVRADKALERLLELMREKELVVPCDARREPVMALTSAASP